MKKIYTGFISLFLIGIFLTACENDSFYYQDTARVRLEGPEIWALGTDSLEFTFLVYPESVTSYTMDMTLYVMGEATDYDRTARIVVSEQYTTATSSQYTVPSQITIPAGQTHVVFPVELNRTEELKEQTVQLYIQIVDSDDFKVGVKEKDHFLFKWNEILSRPANWSSLEEFFGSYSDVKYRFILNTLGVSGLDTDTTSWGQLMSYKVQLVTALDEYNALNPGNPLQDEYGQYVSFDY